MLRLARSSCWFIGPAAFIANCVCLGVGAVNGTPPRKTLSQRFGCWSGSPPDDLIAGILNRNKLTTGNGNRWDTRARDGTAVAPQDPCSAVRHRTGISSGST